MRLRPLGGGLAQAGRHPGRQRGISARRRGMPRRQLRRVAADVQVRRPRLALGLARVAVVEGGAHVTLPICFRSLCRENLLLLSDAGLD